MSRFFDHIEVILAIIKYYYFRSSQCNNVVLERCFRSSKYINRLRIPDTSDTFTMLVLYYFKGDYR